MIKVGTQSFDNYFILLMALSLPPLSTYSAPPHTIPPFLNQQHPNNSSQNPTHLPSSPHCSSSKSRLSTRRRTSPTRYRSPFTRRYRRGYHNDRRHAAYRRSPVPISHTSTEALEYLQTYNVVINTWDPGSGVTEAGAGPTRMDDTPSEEALSPPLAPFNYMLCSSMFRLTIW
jgi:hypothetical protein